MRKRKWNPGDRFLFAGKIYTVTMAVNGLRICAKISATEDQFNIEDLERLRVKKLRRLKVPIGFAIAKEDIVVWKAAATSARSDCKRALVKLKLAKGTVYYNTPGIGHIEEWKKRATHAKVLDVYRVGAGGKLTRVKQAISLFSVRNRQKDRFVYKAGKIVKPVEPFSYAHRACDSGIHFFFKKEHALGFWF